MPSSAALLIAKKYFKERGETQRDKVIVPDTAHGTNPASAAMCGFKVISLPSNERGRVSVDEIRKVVGARYRRLHDDQSEHARLVRRSRSPRSPRPFMKPAA